MRRGASANGRDGVSDAFADVERAREVEHTAVAVGALEQVPGPVAFANTSVAGPAFDF